MSAAIHMLFVFYPIDVIWLDTHKKVLEVATAVQPFRIYCAPQASSRDIAYMIECSAGIVSSSKTRVGDTLVFK